MILGLIDCVNTGGRARTLALPIIQVVAIGAYSELRYQIVDESGQALAPLEDSVETRFGTKAFGNFEVVDIRVLFDLVEVEE